MARFTKDVWSMIMLKIDTVVDFANCSLVCRETAKAGRLIRSKFADRFIINHINHRKEIIESHLPNCLLHGPRLTITEVQWYEFGKPVDAPKGFDALRLYSKDEYIKIWKHR